MEVLIEGYGIMGGITRKGPAFCNIVRTPKPVEGSGGIGEGIASSELPMIITESLQPHVYAMLA